MTTPATEPEGSVGRHSPHPKDTYVFDIAASRRGAAINRLCASLKDERNRRDFLSDEQAYCGRFDLTDEQRRAILDRDWIGMLDLGASIFYMYKLAQVDKRSMQYLGGVFSGMTEEQFRSLMASGGRDFG